MPHALGMGEAGVNAHTKNTDRRFAVCVFSSVSVFWCFDVEIVFHEIDETAFDIGEAVAILDGHAVGDLDAAVADGDDLEIEALVAEHFARDDIGGQAGVLAGGEVFLEADDAGGEGCILRIELVGVEDVPKYGFLPAAVGDEHEGQLGDAFERNGALLVKIRTIFYEKHNMVLKQRDDPGPADRIFAVDARCQGDVGVVR